MLARRTETRRTEAREVRLEAAEHAVSRFPEQINNGEEAQYRTDGLLRYIANYTKGLPHTLIGEVNPKAYLALLRAFDSENPDDFERIPLGLPITGRKLTNPQSGLAFDLEGHDPQSLTIPPAPRIDGPENSAEMAELYWMALLRDVSFRDYGTGAGTDAGPNNTAAAAASLTNDFTKFTGPRDAAGVVIPTTLFRGFAPGDLNGPYVSQFLLIGNADPALGLTPQDGFISYGTLKIDQRQKTALPATDYLTRFEAPFPPVSPVLTTGAPRRRGQTTGIKISSSLPASSSETCATSAPTSISTPYTRPISMPASFSWA